MSLHKYLLSLYCKYKTIINQKIEVMEAVKPRLTQIKKYEELNDRIWEALNELDEKQELKDKLYQIVDELPNETYYYNEDEDSYEIFYLSKTEEGWRSNFLKNEISRRVDLLFEANIPLHFIDLSGLILGDEVLEEI